MIPASEPWYDTFLRALGFTIHSLAAALDNGLLFKGLIFIVFAFMVRVAYKLQKKLNNGVDFTDMIMVNGKVDPVKVGQTVGLIVSTWFVVLYAWRGTASTELLFGWLAIVNGTQIANRVVAKSETAAQTLAQNPAPPPPAPMAATATPTADGGVRLEVSRGGDPLSGEKRT